MLVQLMFLDQVLEVRFQVGRYRDAISVQQFLLQILDLT